MPPVGGGGVRDGGPGVRAGVRRAEFHHKVKYWEEICSFRHGKFQKLAEGKDRCTTCFTFIVSILAGLSTALGASEPPSACDDVPSECYVSRAATVLRDSCGGPANCDASAFGVDDVDDDVWLAFGGLQGLLSLVAGLLAGLVSMIHTIFAWRQTAEAYGSASSRLGLLKGKLEAKSREVGAAARISNEVWAELEKELAEVLQNLGAYYPTLEQRQQATELLPPPGPLPASLIPYREPLTEDLHITQEQDKRWLDGDIELLLERHDIQIEATLLRNLREKSREEFPDHVPIKMKQQDVIKQIEESLHGLGLLDDILHDPSTDDILQRAYQHLKIDPEAETLEKRIGRVCNDFQFETGWEPKCQTCWDEGDHSKDWQKYLADKRRLKLGWCDRRCYRSRWKRCCCRKDASAIDDHPKIWKPQWKCELKEHEEATLKEHSNLQEPA
jgi:hypothetical protein